MSIVTCRSHLSQGVPQLLKQRPAETLFHYVGGTTGGWRVTRAVTHSGLPLKAVNCVEITNGRLDRPPGGSSWVLRGLVSNTRYITREDRGEPEPRDSGHPVAEVTCAALIPIRKSAAWWNLALKERREIQEARWRHLANGLQFVPAVVRRLQTSRNSGEPFDFVTWFEYAPQDSSIFDDLAATLRASEEWRFVEREIDIRLVRDSAS